MLTNSFSKETKFNRKRFDIMKLILAIVKGGSPSIPRGTTRVTVGGATVFVLNVEDCKHL